MTVTDPKQKALADARRATSLAKGAIERRDNAIRRAAVHASLREIADVVGLSKPRVHQIVGSRD